MHVGGFATFQQRCLFADISSDAKTFPVEYNWEAGKDTAQVIMNIHRNFIFKWNLLLGKMSENRKVKRN